MKTMTTGAERARAPRRLPARKLAGLAAALALGVAGMWLASGFTREAPPDRLAPAGISVSADRITLSSGAPQWKVLRRGEARPAGVRWSEWVPARVRIDEARASKVGTPLGGRVSAVFVELGQTVSAGDPLFSVTSHEIAALRAEKEKAGVDLDVARSVLDRVKAMVADRALPAKEEIIALQTFRQAEVALKLADAKLASLRVQATGDDAFSVPAPRDGVVVEKNVLCGQEVAQESSGCLLVIADLSKVWVIADMFEADVADVREGATARVTSPSFPDVTMEATVNMVASVVDPVRHTVSVRVALPNRDRMLRPNLYTQVRFMLEPKRGSVEVPSAAVVSDGARQYVFVEERPGSFRRREVVAGSSREGKVIVLAGVNSGEAIIEEGAVLLDNQISLMQ